MKEGRRERERLGEDFKKKGVRAYGQRERKGECEIKRKRNEERADKPTEKETERQRLGEVRRDTRSESERGRETAAQSSRMQTGH